MKMIVFAGTKSYAASYSKDGRMYADSPHTIRPAPEQIRKRIHYTKNSPELQSRTNTV